MVAWWFLILTHTILCLLTLGHSFSEPEDAEPSSNNLKRDSSQDYTQLKVAGPICLFEQNIGHGWGLESGPNTQYVVQTSRVDSVPFLRVSNFWETINFAGSPFRDQLMYDSLGKKSRSKHRPGWERTQNPPTN